MLVAGIAIAGALGAPVRYLLDGIVSDRVDGVFPLGTFVVNVIGCLVFGAIAGATAQRLQIAPAMRLFLLTGLVLYHAFPTDPKVVLGTGFCGAFTTFSTFAYETVRLAEERAYVAALQNALGSILLPALAAAAGLALVAL